MICKNHIRKKGPWELSIFLPQSLLSYVPGHQAYTLSSSHQSLASIKSVLEQSKKKRFFLKRNIWCMGSLSKYFLQTFHINLLKNSDFHIYIHGNQTPNLFLGQGTDEFLEKCLNGIHVNITENWAIIPPFLSALVLHLHFCKDLTGHFESF